MQQAAEVDLDRLVDYKTEYCSVIKKHKITGDNLTGTASQKMRAETSSHFMQS